MSFRELADLLEAQVAALPEAIEAGAIAGGEIIRDDARNRIGSYQGAVEDLPAWEPLSEATKADRVAKGFTEDDPLLRSGKLRDSIEVRPVPEGAAIGVFDPEMTTIAGAMEYGYANVRAGRSVPPRSFLRAAAATKGEEASVEIAARVQVVFEGKK